MRSIAAIATLDRRLLTNQKLSSYGIMMISDADIDESVSKKIGSGPRSIVFQSLYKDIPVAKKHLFVPELSRISTEYLLLQMLGSHPSIPHAFGLMVEDKECSLIESYVDGLSLSRSRFDDSISLGICAVRLIEAVGHIHNRGVIHNNLQPSLTQFHSPRQEQLCRNEMEERRKQKRALLSDDMKETLVRYYEQGMTNYNKRDDCAIELLGEAEKETGLDRDTIKVSKTQCNEQFKTSH